MYKNEENLIQIYNFMKVRFGRTFAVAVCANIQTETANTFDPQTVQRNKGYTNEEYIRKVYSGEVDFINDKIGFGLFQHTKDGRKSFYWNFFKEHGYRIGDLLGTLYMFEAEIQTTGYGNVRKAIQEGWSLEDCTRIICTEYERPKSMQSESTKEVAIKNRINHAYELKKFFDEKEGKEAMKSPLTDITMLSPNHSGKRKYKLTRFVPHCTAVSITAKRIGEIFQNPNRNASCNYGIGNDCKIVCVVEEENRSWCTSSAWCDNGAITVECSSSNVAPYQFDNGVFDKLVALGVDICKRYGINKVIWIPDKKAALAYECNEGEIILLVHRWFANKACPGQWMMDRMQTLCDRMNNALNNNTAPMDETVKPEGVLSTIKYTVKKGDTLSKIAKEYGVTIAQILATPQTPPIDNPNVISVGQVINIPVNDVYHIVNREDKLTSLSKIAKAYGITLAEIKSLNPQVKAPLYIIHVGDKIRVK